MCPKILKGCQFYYEKRQFVEIKITDLRIVSCGVSYVKYLNSVTLNLLKPGKQRAYFFLNKKIL